MSTDEEQIDKSSKKKKIPICNICYDKLTKDTYLRCPICKQFFCKQCIKKWLLNVKNNKYCPLCAKKWDDIFISNNLPLGFVIYDLHIIADGLCDSNVEIDDINHSNKKDNDDEEHNKGYVYDKEDFRPGISNRHLNEVAGDILVSTDDLDTDPETLNLIRSLLLDDLFD